jgi:hypothetical protein
MFHRDPIQSHRERHNAHALASRDREHDERVWDRRESLEAADERYEREMDDERRDGSEISEY